MARITDYTSLGTALQAYTGSTVTSGGNFDYMLSEAEEEMNSRLRVRRMLTSVTPTVGSTGIVTLPSDFAGWKRFQVRDGVTEWDLNLIAADQTTDVTQVYSQPNGTPRALITNGATSQILPYINGSYTFVGLYYAKIPQLTSGASTNWVITNYPNAYLYGCLAASRGFAADDSPTFNARMDKWQAMFSRAISRIQADDAAEVDARSNVTLQPNTTLFGGSSSNILSGE
jgi:hypothetical protein